MTLAEARALVRTYINEPKAQTWTDALLNSIIVEANREIYNRIVALCPQWFAGATQYSWPANTPRLNLQTKADVSAVTIGPLVRILAQFTSQQSGNIGASNIPMAMRPFQDVAGLYNSSAQLTSSGSTVSSQNTAYSQTTIYGYCVLGPTMYIWPVPTVAIVINLFAIPSVASPVADADTLLTPGLITNATQLLDHQELVPLLAAIKVKTSVGDPDGGLSGIYRSRLEATERVLAISQSIQNPAQVRGVSI